MLRGSREDQDDAWVKHYSKEALPGGVMPSSWQQQSAALLQREEEAMPAEGFESVDDGEESDDRNTLQRRVSSRRLSRDPSHENLFIDVSRTPMDATSELFLENLIQEEVRSLQNEEQLEPIVETVGFAMPSVGKGSLVSSVFTLVASAMGAGCLSLPHMFRQSGVGLGLLLLLSGALLAHISLVVLMSCAKYTECRSFAELVALSGRPESQRKSPKARQQGGAGFAGGAMAVDVVIALYGVAAVLIYMILIGDFLSGIVLSPAIGWASASRGKLILASLLVVLPLSLPRHISALRFVCVLSTGSILFLTVVVLARTPGLLAKREAVPGAAEEGIQWFAGDLQSTLQSFAIAIFAFAAHTNAVPMVAVLDNPRAVRIWQVSLSSVLLELVVYVTIALSGYLSFLAETQQDFIRNYPHDDTLMLIVRCIYSVPVIFGVPINLSPAAASLQELTRRAAAHNLLPARLQRSLGNGGSGGAASSSGEFALHAAIVSTVLCLCALTAICNEAVADVIGLLGSFFGSLICLWWPQKIYASVLSRLHSRSLAMLIRSVLLLATGLGALAFLVQLHEAIS